MLRQADNSRRVKRGSDEETAILLLLIKRSQAGEFGHNDFGRHLPVERHGTRWQIGDQRCGGALYLLTDKQAAAVALGRCSITAAKSYDGEWRWPTLSDRFERFQEAKPAQLAQLALVKRKRSA